MSKDKRLKKKSLFRRILLSVSLFLLCILLLVTGYVIYVFSAYYRLDDNIQLVVDLPPDETETQTLSVGQTYTLLSFNIGFGAYEPDFGFFMDGGTEGRAFSEERVTVNIAAIGSYIAAQDADFILLQEVDVDATRSYHVNQVQILSETLSAYTRVYAQNWDSPYLWLPIIRPHGSAKTGLLSLAKTSIDSALRVQLPVEDSVMKIVDLDRCYTKMRISIPDTDKELILYNMHLSAYTSDGKIAEDQLRLLLSDMQAEYNIGNYTLCGGDFNKDLLGNSAERFGVSDNGYTWAQPFPTSLLPENITLQIPTDNESPVPSCRNADGPYNSEQFVLTVDGFLCSSNIDVVICAVDDVGFAYSDHNPVRLVFTLR